MTDLSDVSLGIEEFLALVPEGAGDVRAGADGLSFGTLLSALFRRFLSEGQSLLPFFSALLGIALLSLLTDSLTEGTPGAKTAKDGLSLVFAVTVFGLLSGTVTPVYDLLCDLYSFFSLSVPFLFTVTAGGGGVGCAGAQSVTFYALLWLMEGVLRLFLPVTALLFALALIRHLSPAVDALADGCRRFCLFLFTAVGTVFSATLAFQTVWKSASDSLAVRTAKYSASTLIPVVGNAVSGAVSTLATALSLLKDSVGLIGIYTLFALVAPVLIRLLLVRAALSLFSRFSDAPVFRAFLPVLDVSVGTAVFSLLLYLFSFLLFMKSGVAALGGGV